MATAAPSESIQTYFKDLPNMTSCRCSRKKKGEKHNAASEIQLSSCIVPFFPGCFIPFVTMCARVESDDAEEHGEGDLSSFSCPFSFLEGSSSSILLSKTNGWNQKISTSPSTSSAKGMPHFRRLPAIHLLHIRLY
jgi:hypothetical protein